MLLLKDVTKLFTRHGHGLLSSRCEQQIFIQFITASKHYETVDVIFIDKMSLISVFILCKQFCSCVWSVTLIYYVKMVTYKEYLS